ncbi:MAG: hypothetical protein AAF633_17445, partial [Chloroflexota bacterium]
DEFLQWRLTEHQQSNSSMQGVIKTDFARIHQAALSNEPPPYRFMTTVDWPDQASFEAGFYDPDVQSGLEKNLEMLSNPLFLISEIMTTAQNSNPSEER